MIGKNIVNNSTSGLKSKSKNIVEAAGGSAAFGSHSCGEKSRVQEQPKLDWNLAHHSQECMILMTPQSLGFLICK